MTNPHREPRVPSYEELYEAHENTTAQLADTEAQLADAKAQLKSEQAKIAKQNKQMRNMALGAVGLAFLGGINLGANDRRDSEAIFHYYENSGGNKTDGNFVIQNSDNTRVYPYYQVFTNSNSQISEGICFEPKQKKQSTITEDWFRFGSWVQYEYNIEHSSGSTLEPLKAKTRPPTKSNKSNSANLGGMGGAYSIDFPQNNGGSDEFDQSENNNGTDSFDRPKSSERLF